MARPRFRPFGLGRGRRRARRRLLQPAGLGAANLASSQPVAGGLRVLGSGDVAFQAILARITAAERSVEIRAFLWRDDEAGNLLGKAVLAAAERGAKVTIHKDRIAAVYEYTGGNKQSFFHKRVDPIRGLQAWVLGAVYRAPGSFKQRPNALADAILAHPNITVEHHRKRFDHSKLYIVDDRFIALGSMGIGDNHRHDWIDVMVEAEGPEHVTRLRERMSGHDEFDPSRGLDFLVHSREAHRKNSCPMISHRLALIDAARHALTVEMAYLGDRRFTAALARAVQRDVEVRLVTADQADVLGATNRATCDMLRRLTGAPANLEDRAAAADGAQQGRRHRPSLYRHRLGELHRAVVHGVYDEINLYADCAPFAAALEVEIDAHCEDGRLVDQSLRWRRAYSGFERAVMAYQARRGG